MPKVKPGQKQKQKIDAYFSPTVRQNIFTKTLEDEYKSIQCENAEKSTTSDIISISTESEELHTLKEENQKLKSENAKLLKDNKLLKKLLNDAKSCIFHKDLKLQKMAETTKKNSTILYQKYEKYFSRNEMIHLRSIKTGERSDSTFIQKCLIYLYGDTNSLVNRVPSRVKVPYGKIPMSPEKVDILTDMLQERIESEGIADDAAIVRKHRMPKLLNNAFSSVNRLNKAKPLCGKPKNDSTNTPEHDIQPMENAPVEIHTHQPQQNLIWLTPKTPIQYGSFIQLKY